MSTIAEDSCVEIIDYMVLDKEYHFNYTIEEFYRHIIKELEKEEYLYDRR